MAPRSHASVSPEGLAEKVKRRAADLGFDRCGITDLAPTPHGTELDAWIASGMAGDMRYMHRQAARRRNPATILAGATRAVVVTKHYQTPDPEWKAGHGKIAKYARGPDYHETLAKPLEQLRTFVVQLGGPNTLGRALIDAGPVPERELAQRAGLGWIGKNTMLIDPAKGSYSFLATVLTDLSLAKDQPFESDRCGTCRLCLDACPTDAFRDERVLDSRRCISYLTIELKGDIDPTLAAKMDGWVFGCDACQTACPWNQKFAAPSAGPELKMGPHNAMIELSELANISDDEFSQRFVDTPLSRPGAKGMRRNAAAALQSGRL